MHIELKFGAVSLLLCGVEAATAISPLVRLCSVLLKLLQFESSTGSSGCDICPAGYYCGSIGLSAITGECSKGTYSAAGASVCTDCSSGRYSTSSGESGCSSCVAGQYASAESSDCTACAVGKVSYDFLTL